MPAHTSVDSGEEDAPARAAIGLARVAFPSPLGGPRMKSACSSKGDDARQGAVGLRNIAVCCNEMHFYLSIAERHCKCVGSGQGLLCVCVLVYVSS